MTATKTMLAWSYGPYQLVWVGNEAEVRDSNGWVQFSSTREECVNWLRRKGYNAN